jgi:hypothetical protein
MRVLDTGDAVVHVRFEGRSVEVPLASLELSREATDAEIKRALTALLDRPMDFFDEYVVVRYPAAIVVRPEAVYG